MENSLQIISPTCKRRLQIQGYQNYSDKELNDYKYGIRFAYILCTTLFGLGLLLSNLTVLIVAAAIATIGAFPPYHPFDYLYNYAIRHILNKPKMPPRTNQGRFACGIAAIWLAITIYLLHSNYTVAGYILGGMLLVVAILVSALDICIPSIIYNALFKREQQKTN
jgi:hypothetical protein